MKNKKMSTIFGEFIGMILVGVIIVVALLVCAVVLGFLLRLAQALWFVN
ncbi:hypothetical protein [Lactococcus sp. DD01]|nr:hypothetical protein [Lactococcus sp. DD01]KXT61459.1 hypothetical protein LACDD01_01407 [Lactococcus sp. DD01]